MSDLDVAARSVKAWKVSAHHGAGEWLAERFTSLVLIPLTLWCLWAASQMVGTGFDGAMKFLADPVHAGVIAATMLISVWHMYMGLKVIVDDYLAGPMRGFVMVLVVLLSLAVLVATGGGLWFVYSGAV